MGLAFSVVWYTSAAAQAMANTTSKMSDTPAKADLATIATSLDYAVDVVEVKAEADYHHSNSCLDEVGDCCLGSDHKERQNQTDDEGK